MSKICCSTSNTHYVAIPVAQHPRLATIVRILLRVLGA